MKITQIKPGIFFCDVPGPASNLFYVRSGKEVLWIDTGTSTADVQLAMESAGVGFDEIIMLINTHADGDHVGGNSLFQCPRLAHETVLERMVEHGRPENERPTRTFHQPQKDLTVGDIRIELIHTAGHKPDQTILWLPEQKVLIASDLLFENCYPYMVGGHVEDWIAALKSLSAYQADVILPGHGTLSGYAEIEEALDYFETSYALAKSHREAGASLEETLRDPAFPRPTGWEREGRFETNLEEFFKQAG